ncbi:MAG TPA: hypothetical protein VGW12_16460 [Pyrinomonadaceae bacterium]|nr:hypothetical protein [Pyrinomonadaceae bacterium]
MLALGAFMLVPTATFAQDWRYGQDRDDRWERRDDRRDRRRDRREERRERRQERRAARYGNSYDGYPNYGGSFELRQTALNAGYNEGTKEGRKDRSRNERFDYSDESVYRSGTKDYSSRLGDRSLYQEYLRMAFEKGYSDGYNGY